ncbi:MAG: DNA primase, partial [Bacteroidales bacterium]|nr:DNA primase [Bacteroidales bacterium]
MIPQEVIDRICEKDLLSFLEGEGLSFTKKGAEYWCCCPFHGEKTPSFKVSPSRNTYHCFGCGESGNIISYVMRMRGLRFFEAVEFLADKFGIEYEKREETAEEMEERFRKERTMTVNDIALKFFRLQLQAPAAKDY